MKTNPYADPHHEKHEAYNAAAALLAKQDEGVLRYAALELRRCIEAIVYEKLRIYGDLLPEGSVHQWQPPQAFDALIAIEPGAEATFTYAVAPETEPGKMATGPYHAVGVDERPQGEVDKESLAKAWVLFACRLAVCGPQAQIVAAAVSGKDAHGACASGRKLLLRDAVHEHHFYLCWLRDAGEGNGKGR